VITAVCGLLNGLVVTIHSQTVLSAGRLITPFWVEEILSKEMEFAMKTAFLVAWQCAKIRNHVTIALSIHLWRIVLT
jgi:hypothetical protein